MTEMVERVLESAEFREAIFTCVDAVVRNLSEIDGRRNVIRAVITAMQEPTEAMLEAEEDVLLGELGGLHDSAYWTKEWPKRIWYAMIQAALGAKP